MTSVISNDFRRGEDRVNIILGVIYMELRNFVIDRVLRGIMLHSSTGEALWSINQIEDPSLSVSADTTDAVDALGIPIMTFDRAKNAEFSASNSLFDLGLLAAQSGTSIEQSSASVLIEVPCFEEVKKGESATVTLKHTPNDTGAAGIPFIYALNGDGTLGVKYPYAATASASAFSFTGTTLTLPTGAAAGDMFLVIYNYNANGDDEAVSVTNSATNFPTAGKFVMEVLGCDVCDISTKYYAYLIFPQAKLTSDFDLTFATDGNHPFTIKCMQEYCDHEKKLFQLVIPEGDTEA